MCPFPQRLDDCVVPCRLYFRTVVSTDGMVYLLGKLLPKDKAGGPPFFSLRSGLISFVFPIM